MRLLKTFLVEDSPLIRDNLIATLEELASVVVLGSAADEDAAIAWLGQAEHQVDLVIVDIFLARGSGLGVLRRASGLQSGAKRVVLTNYATVEIRRKCLELGADQVFDKSEEIDALIQYCDRLADGTASKAAPLIPA
jgi:DNA-binding NarL/FixJ family response regulator